MSARGSTTLFRVVGPRPGAIDVRYDADPVEGSARVTWFDPGRGSWFQTYYDTPPRCVPSTSWPTRRARGVGMWTLGYDWGDPGYPALVDEVFRTAGPRRRRGDGLGRPRCAHHGTRLPGPRPDARHPRLRRWRRMVRLARPGMLAPGGDGLAWRLPDGPDGPRTVHLQAGDDAGTLSTDTTVEVRAGRVPPVLAGPSLRPGPVPGSWWVLLDAMDEGGPARVEVRWTVGDTLVRDWAPLSSLAAGSLVAPVDRPVTVEARAIDLAGRTTSGSATAPAGSWYRP
ncbi:MAG: hypothetical protein R3C32_05535 [Chloroflexota bacterium]